jgi:hypothetical protein
VSVRCSRFVPSLSALPELNRTTRGTALALRTESGAFFFGEWREAPVVTHHRERSQAFLSLCLVGTKDFFQLFAVNGQRLFDQDRFVIGQRGHDVAGVTVVTGEDKHRVRILVLQQFHRWCSAGKAEQPPG